MYSFTPDKIESGPEEEVEEDQEEEEEELRAPEQEVILDLNTITEEERQAIPEFFEGRPSKTPERYLKIRNFILDQWWDFILYDSEELFLVYIVCPDRVFVRQWNSKNVTYFREPVVFFLLQKKWGW